MKPRRRVPAQSLPLTLVLGGGDALELTGLRRAMSIRVNLASLVMSALRPLIVQKRRFQNAWRSSLRRRNSDMATKMSPRARSHPQAKSSAPIGAGVVGPAPRAPSTFANADPEQSGIVRVYPALNFTPGALSAIDWAKEVRSEQPPILFPTPPRDVRMGSLPFEDFLVQGH